MFGQLHYTITGYREMAIPPGNTILELLTGFKNAIPSSEDMHEYARTIGMSDRQFDRLICGEIPITEDVANKLSPLAPASFWLDLQKAYDRDVKAVENEFYDEIVSCSKILVHDTAKTIRTSQSGARIDEVWEEKEAEYYGRVTGYKVVVKSWVHKSGRKEPYRTELCAIVFNNGQTKYVPLRYVRLINMFGLELKKEEERINAADTYDE